MKQENMRTNDVAVYRIMEEILLSYMKKENEASDEQWMVDTLKCYCPNASKTEIEVVSHNIQYELEKVCESWNNIIASERKGYNSQVWLFHEVQRNIKDNENQNLLTSLLLQNVSMERLNEKIAQEVLQLNPSTIWNIYGKRNGNNDDIDFLAFHNELLCRLRSIFIEEYEALIKAGVNPLLMKQQDLNQLAYDFSKNSTTIGITNMIFMAEFFLAKNLQQHGIQEENRILVGKLVESSIRNGIDFGIRKAVATALKISAERGLIPILMKGTPTATFTGIAFVAVESSKIFLQYSKGELTGWEVFNQTSKISATGICSTALDVKGAAIGASAGTMILPGFGTYVGGFVGGIICSSVGQMITPHIYEQAKRMEGNLFNILMTDFRANKRSLSISELNYEKSAIPRNLQV